MVPLAAEAPPGCFVEVGVYLGGSAELLYDITERQGRTLHLFDTFTGIPFQGKLDSHIVGDFNSAGQEIRLQQALPNARIHKGIFPQTLPENLQDIAFVHADGDQYQTTADILQHLYPRLVPGGMIVFDDYGTPMCHGCTAAVDEFVARERLEDYFDKLKGGGRARLLARSI